MVDPPVSAAPVTGFLNIPFAIILQSIPAEYLRAPLTDLLSQPQAATEVGLPLGQILPMLPSGKVEFSIQEISAWIPDGFVQRAEVLGEAAGNMFTLPLFQVASRIPPDAMVLRTDQRPIDVSVLSMNDPFSPEMLGMARAAAPVAEPVPEPVPAAIEETPQPEPQPEVVAEEIAQPAAVEMAVLPAIEEEVPVPVVETPSIDWNQALSEMQVAEQPAPEPELTPAPAPEIPDAVIPDAVAEPDLSFAHSEEFRRFVAQMEQQAAEPVVEESVAGEVTPEMQLSPEGVSPEVVAESMQVESESDPVPPPPEGVVFGKTLSLESALAAPTRPLTIPPPRVFQATPPPQGFQEALKQISSPGKPASRVVPPPQATEPMLFHASDHPPQHRLHNARLSASINKLLGLQAGQEIGLRDVVEQIRRWPGMTGCIIAGKDGLPITSVTDDHVYAQSLSAFAPKILGRVNELFTDLGSEEANEIHVPMAETSTYIFRYRDIFFIVLCREATLPESYSLIIKEILKEIASG